MDDFKFTTIVPFNGKELKMEIGPVINRAESIIEKSLNDKEITLEPGFYAGVILNQKLQKEERLNLGIIKAKDNRGTLITHLIMASRSQTMDELVEKTYQWIRELEVELISASNRNKTITATAG